MMARLITIGTYGKKKKIFLTGGKRIPIIIKPF